MSPLEYPSLAAWYDASNRASMIYDSAGRVSLLSDISGRSNVNGLVLNGVVGNYASTPDSPELNVGINFSLIWDGVMDTYVPSSTTVLIGKWSTPSRRQYQLTVSTSGNLVCAVSSNGENATVIVLSSTVTLASIGDYTRKALRVDYLGATASATFYTANTAAGPWVQLGASVTGTPTIPFISTAPLEIGSSSGGNSTLLVGKTYSAKVIDGAFTGGTVVFDADFTAQSKLATSFTESSANAATVTINSTGDTGARICGERDLVQLTASKQPIYLPFSGEKYGYLNGVVGNYFSAPSVSATVTELDVKWYGSMDDWSPASDSIVVGRSTATGNQRSWFLRITTGQSLLLSLSQDGSSSTTATSSSALVGFSDRSKHWIRATWRASDGRVQFFDGGTEATPSWVQIGTDQSIALASIYNSSAPITISGINLGALQPFAGTCYAATVSHTIGGAAVTSFNVQDYNSGSTFVSSATGETWTLNGGSHIVQRNCIYFDGSNDALLGGQILLPEYPRSAHGVVNFSGASVGGGSAGYFNIRDGGTESRFYAGYGTAGGYTAGFLGMRSGVTSVRNLFLISEKTAEFIAISNLYGDSYYGRKNRLEAASGSTTVGTPDLITDIRLGGSGGSGESMSGAISEFILFTGIDSPDRRDRLALYAGRKWGIAV